MDGTIEAERLVGLLPSDESGLSFLCGGMEIDAGGHAWYRGTRPSLCGKCKDQKTEGLAFHVHGWTDKLMVTLRSGSFISLPLHKARWKCAICGATIHSRPLDDLLRMRVCTLVIVLFVAAALLKGKDKARLVLPESSEAVADVRTVGRWLQRVFRNSINTHQSIREAILERCEPRPVEELFRSGLSPPHRLLQRAWLSAKDVSRIWSSFALISAARRDLKVPTAQLLARAHVSTKRSHRPFLI